MKDIPELIEIKMRVYVKRWAEYEFKLCEPYPSIPLLYDQLKTIGMGYEDIFDEIFVSRLEIMLKTKINLFTN